MYFISCLGYSTAELIQLQDPPAFGQLPRRVREQPRSEVKRIRQLTAHSSSARSPHKTSDMSRLTHRDIPPDMLTGGPGDVGGRLEILKSTSAANQRKVSKSHAAASRFAAGVAIAHWIKAVQSDEAPALTSVQTPRGRKPEEVHDPECRGTGAVLRLEHPEHGRCPQRPNIDCRAVRRQYNAAREQSSSMSRIPDIWGAQQPCSDNSEISDAQTRHSGRTCTTGTFCAIQSAESLRANIDPYTASASDHGVQSQFRTCTRNLPSSSFLHWRGEQTVGSP
jgi:hypothetical protein